jgi:hypothetical protein
MHGKDALGDAGEVTDSVHAETELPPDLVPAWDAVMAGNGYYHSSQWLSRTRAGGVYYVHVGTAAVLSATATIHLPARSRNALMLPSERLREAAAGEPDDLRPRRWLEVDVDEAVFVFGRSLAPSAVGFAPDPACDRSSFLDGCLAAAGNLAREHGRPALVALGVPRGGALHEYLDRRGFYGVPGLAHYRLSTAGLSSFEDYLGRLSSNRRSSIRRERRSLAALSFEEGILAPEHAELFAPLLATTATKYGPGENLAGVAQRLRDTAKAAPQCRYVAAYDPHHDCCVGVILFFTWADVVYATEVGVAADQPTVYFELTYYRLVEIACRERHTAIDYSVGSGSTKVSRGCVETPTVTMFRAVD